MPPAELAGFACKYCGRSFDEGRKLGGHVRQAHHEPRIMAPALKSEGEMAARVLDMWKRGTDPYSIVSVLRVPPGFVRKVLKDYDELLNEWKKSSEAESSAARPAATGNATSASRGSEEAV